MKKLFAIALFSLAGFVGQAQADVVSIDTQSSFSALGSISQNTNFDAYVDEWTYPGSPFTVGSLTFVEGGRNLIGGSLGYSMSRNLLTDDYISGTTVNISGNYNLFSLNAGNFINASNTSFNVTTNLGSYSFDQNIGLAANGGALTFVGFKASQGEFFTSVRVYGSGATGFTDVQIGSVSAVPEPETYAMLFAGLGLIGAAVKRRKAKQA